MKHQDLMELMGALAPVLHEAMRDACAPLVKQLDEANQRIKELENRPAPVVPEIDVAQVLPLISQELSKTMPGLKETLFKELQPASPMVPRDAVQAMIAESLEGFSKTLPAVPTVDQIIKLIPAPKEVDLSSLKLQIEVAVENEVNASLEKAVAQIQLPAVPTVDEVVFALLPKIPAPQPGKDADPEVVQNMVAEAVKQIILPQAPTAEEVAALIPAPKAGDPGKDADPAVIQKMVQDAVLAIELPKVPTAEEVALLIPKPKDGDPGKSVDMEEVKVLVAEAVEETVEEAIKKIELPQPPTVEQVAALVPKPKDGDPGKSVEPATIKVLIDEALTQVEMPAVPTVDEVVEKILPLIPKPKDGDPGKSVELAEVKALVEEAVANIPKIVQDGKDADPEVTKALVLEAVAAAVPKAEDVAKLIPLPKDGKSFTLEEARPIIEAALEEAVKKLPVPKDGLGLSDAIIDRDDNLIVTMTDGTTKNLGKVVGMDGLGFDDIQFVDEDTTFKIRLVRGDRVKEWTLKKPTIADGYKGVWKKGNAYTSGDLVTWGGSLFIAKVDSLDEPGTSDAWKLAVKRGQNGKDHTGGSTTPSTVKLK
jgi:hypothetical protein